MKRFKFPNGDAQVTSADCDPVFTCDWATTIQLQSIVPVRKQVELMPEWALDFHDGQQWALPWQILPMCCVCVFKRSSVTEEQPSALWLDRLALLCDWIVLVHSDSGVKTRSNFISCNYIIKDDVGTLDAQIHTQFGSDLLMYSPFCITTVLFLYIFDTWTNLNSPCVCLKKFTKIWFTTTIITWRSQSLSDPIFNPYILFCFLLSSCFHAHFFSTSFQSSDNHPAIKERF